MHRWPSTRRPGSLPTSTPPSAGSGTEQRQDPAGRGRRGTHSAGMTTTAPALADRMLAGVLGSMEIAAVALGHRLGWYRQLADSSPLTPAELAGRSGTDER